MNRIVPFCLLVLLAAAPAGAELVATLEIVDIPSAGWAWASTSDDGSVTAINSGGSYYRVVDGEVEYLGFGHFLSWSVGVSGDGAAIMGTMVDPGTGWRNPARWTAADGWTLLGGVPGGLQCDNDLGSGYAMNGDGTAGAGLAWSTQLCKAAGFLWTLEDGMIQLEREQGWSCRASNISADGLTVVGWAENTTNGQREPARWVDNGALDRILGPNRQGECNAATADGSVICGTVDYNKAMIWSEAGGLTVVDSPAGGAIYLLDIAEDGTTVGNYSGTACVRFPDGVVHGLQAWLIAHGAEIPAGHSLTSATSIAADASTIVGTWAGPNFTDGVFIARLEPATSVPVQGVDGAGIELEGVFPNPFNPSTAIRFTLAAEARVTLAVFDASGRVVIELLSGAMSAGRHEVEWNGRDAQGRPAASGAYLIELRSGSEVRVAKALLTK